MLYINGLVIIDPLQKLWANFFDMIQNNLLPTNTLLGD